MTDNLPIFEDFGDIEEPIPPGVVKLMYETDGYVESCVALTNDEYDALVAATESDKDSDIFNKIATRVIGDFCFKSMTWTLLSTHSDWLKTVMVRIIPDLED